MLEHQHAHDKNDDFGLATKNEPFVEHGHQVGAKHNAHLACILDFLKKHLSGAVLYLIAANPYVMDKHHRVHLFM